MAAPTYTLTGNVHDLVGNAPTSDTSGLRVKGYLEASQQLINDASTNEQRIGRYPLSFDATGDFTVTAQGTGSIVAGYRVVLTYVDASQGSQQQTFTSGWFPLTANTTFAAALASTLVITQVDTSTVQSVYAARDAATASATSAASSATSAQTSATTATNNANGFGIGTVSTLTNGQPATATITGTAPNRLLNLGLPVGLKGDSGAAGTPGSTGYGGPGTAISAPDLRIKPVAATGGTVFAVGLDSTRTMPALNLARDTVLTGDFSLTVKSGSTTATGSVVYTTMTSLHDGWRGTASLTLAGVTVGVEAVVVRLAAGIWRKTITLTASAACTVSLYQGHRAPTGGTYKVVTFEAAAGTPTAATGVPLVGITPTASTLQGAFVGMVAEDGVRNQWGRVDTSRVLYGSATDFGIQYGAASNGDPAATLAAGVPTRFALDYFTAQADTANGIDGIRRRATTTLALATGYGDRDRFDQLLAVTARARLSRLTLNGTGAWLNPAGQYAPYCYVRDGWWTLMGLDDPEVSRDLLSRFAGFINSSNRGPLALGIDQSGTSYTAFAYYLDDTNANMLMWNLWHYQRYGDTILTAAQRDALVAGILSNLDSANNWMNTSTYSNGWVDSLIMPDIPDGSWSSALMQGLTYVGLKAAVAMGATVADATLKAVLANFVGYYDTTNKYVRTVKDLRSSGSYPFTWSDVFSIQPDFWANFLLGESLLSSTQVAAHLDRVFNTNPQVMTGGGIALKCIVNADGTYLDTRYWRGYTPQGGNTAPPGGIYQNGGSWLLHDFLALVVGRIHGYANHDLDQAWEQRVVAEVGVDFNSHEQINLTSAHPTLGAAGYGTCHPFSFAYGWNACVLAVAPWSGLRRRSFDAMPALASRTFPAIAGAAPPSPGVTVTDGFTRADSTSLGNADTGQAWSNVVGTWGIVSQSARINANTNGGLALVDFAASDVDVSARINFSGGSADTGVVARATASGSDYVWADLEGSPGAYQVRLAKQVAGTGGLITTSANMSTALPRVLRLVVKGTTATVYLDGTQVLTGTVPAAAAGGTRVGLRDGATSGARAFYAFSAVNPS